MQMNAKFYCVHVLGLLASSVFLSTFDTKRPLICMRMCVIRLFLVVCFLCSLVSRVLTWYVLIEDNSQPNPKYANNFFHRLSAAFVSAYFGLQRFIHIYIYIPKLN